MTSWIEQAVHRGILTSAYPRRPATEDELPVTGRPPVAARDGRPADAGVDRCPVGAIAPGTVDQGRCIRCARCLADGFRFAGPVEAARTRRDALVGPTVADPGSPPALAPLGRSLHVFLVDVGSCRACNLEVLGLAAPQYDLQRLGLFFTNSPRHADVLLVVGVPTEEMVEPLRRAYEALPAPKAVVAVGACAISGGVFRGTAGLRGAVEEIVPVDLFVPGCPPAPIQVLDGLLRLIGRNRPGASGP
ncbi:MAG TPA: NADH-quinone oxidoreductase subunit NuoB [Thermoplasmata archaeon]|nr:NADH-quinone oxidoreductase subunit NuoB [Thermoplasmata archaeon]